MDFKRLTLFAGHYGSGKTNIALNYAVWLREKGLSVTMADLDIVNPYFRTKDSEEALNKLGIELICSPFANSNLDVPAMPKEIYALVDDHSQYGVLDIGGDDRGALALGRYAPEILSEGNYEMLFVINRSRPLTRTVDDTLSVMREIEAAGGRVDYVELLDVETLENPTAETKEALFALAAYFKLAGNRLKAALGKLLGKPFSHFFNRARNSRDQKSAPRGFNGAVARNAVKIIVYVAVYKLLNFFGR